ncbi:MAG: hypothetical protein HYU77_00525 [Betaproteobacteria bacterium]|nr:hypothetical protein [Betaproteobacteria bacterium]
MNKIALVSALMLAVSGAAFAKLPPPSEEAKAKAAEAKAKADHGNKVAAYKLCLSMNNVAEKHIKEQKAKGKTVKPTDTPACQDPGAAPGAAPAAPAKTAAAPAKK